MTRDHSDDPLARDVVSELELDTAVASGFTMGWLPGSPLPNSVPC